MAMGAYVLSISSNTLFLSNSRKQRTKLGDPNFSIRDMAAYQNWMLDNSTAANTQIDDDRTHTEDFYIPNDPTRQPRRYVASHPLILFSLTVYCLQGRNITYLCNRQTRHGSFPHHDHQWIFWQPCHDRHRYNHEQPTRRLLHPCISTQRPAIPRKPHQGQQTPSFIHLSHNHHHPRR